MDNQILKMRVDQLEKNVSDLQRDNEGLKQTALNVATIVEGLCQKVSMLEDTLATKTDITHVKQLIKQYEVVKKINESEEPIIVEHTTDTIKCRVREGV